MIFLQEKCFVLFIAPKLLFRFVPMNLVSPISERTSSPILSSLMSFCFPDPVVIRVSKPKHDPFSLTISVLTGISPRQNMLNYFKFNFLHLHFGRPGHPIWISLSPPGGYLQFKNSCTGFPSVHLFSLDLIPLLPSG